MRAGIWSFGFLPFCFSFIKTSSLILSVLAREPFLWDRRGEENPLVNIISTKQPVFKDHDKKANRYYVITHPSLCMSAFLWFPSTLSTGWCELKGLFVSRNWVWAVYSLLFQMVFFSVFSFLSLSFSSFWGYLIEIHAESAGCKDQRCFRPAVVTMH